MPGITLNNNRSQFTKSLFGVDATLAQAASKNADDAAEQSRIKGIMLEEAKRRAQQSGQHYQLKGNNRDGYQLTGIFGTGHNNFQNKAGEDLGLEGTGTLTTKTKARDTASMLNSFLGNEGDPKGAREGLDSINIADYDLATEDGKKALKTQMMSVLSNSGMSGSLDEAQKAVDSYIKNVGQGESKNKTVSEQFSHSLSQNVSGKAGTETTRSFDANYIDPTRDTRVLSAELQELNAAAAQGTEALTKVLSEQKQSLFNSYTDRNKFANMAIDENVEESDQIAAGRSQQDSGGYTTTGAHARTQDIPDQQPDTPRFVQPGRSGSSIDMESFGAKDQYTKLSSNLQGPINGLSKDLADKLYDNGEVTLEDGVKLVKKGNNFVAEGSAGKSGADLDNMSGLYNGFFHNTAVNSTKKDLSDDAEVNKLENNVESFAGKKEQDEIAGGLESFNASGTMLTGERLTNAIQSALNAGLTDRGQMASEIAHNLKLDIREQSGTDALLEAIDRMINLNGMTTAN